MKPKLLSPLTAALATLLLCASCSSFSRSDKEIITTDPDSLLHILVVDDDTENAVLRAKSEDISIRTIKGNEYRTLVQRMIKTVSDTSVGGVGIAGPQVGINKRIVAVQRFDKEGEPFEAYPNIRIVEYSEERQRGFEGCLSVPGRREKVSRSQQIVISYTSPTTYKPMKDTIQGFTAVIFQHEIDHLEGTIYTDRLPKIIAHRGYWDTANSVQGFHSTVQDSHSSAQNSRSSVQNAIDIHCWGAEIDVYLTPDNHLVLMHDPVYQNHKMEETPYSILKDVKLPNGETIPTLDEILALITAQKSTKLIIEIKPHSTPELEKAAVAKAIQTVAALNAQNMVEYISFSPVICEAIIAADHQAKVSYLDGTLDPVQLKEKGYSGLDYHMNVLRNNPRWIDQAHELGLTVNVWTVNDSEDFDYFLQAGVDFITTNRPTYSDR